MGAAPYGAGPRVEFAGGNELQVIVCLPPGVYKVLPADAIEPLFVVNGWTLWHSPSYQQLPVTLRTARWYHGSTRDNYLHRSWMKRGLPDDAFAGRPMIGICNSASELAPCNQHLDELAEHVKRGVWESGGVPLEFPVMSLGEAQIQPTAMLLRNLMAMDVEESIRGNPIDGVVLLAGCDKTTPAMVMGAASVDVPAIMLTGGPMLTGRHQGRRLGSATDVWRMSEAVRAGTLSEEAFLATER